MNPVNEQGIVFNPHKRVGQEITWARGRRKGFCIGQTYGSFKDGYSVYTVRVDDKIIEINERDLI
jgi:hypothetical protein